MSIQIFQCGFVDSGLHFAVVSVLALPSENVDDARSISTVDLATAGAGAAGFDATGAVALLIEADGASGLGVGEGLEPPILREMVGGGAGASD